jgi:hypothetical protein
MAVNSSKRARRVLRVRATDPLKRESSMKVGLHRVDVGRMGRLLLSPNWPASRGRIAADRDGARTELARTGMVVLPGLIDPALCDQTVADYADYESKLLAAGVALRDKQQRNHRLANFHLESPNAMRIGCTEKIHVVLDEYFGRRSMVYTSLYYKHGSQQKTHLDTPFFVTRPVGWFAGVWVALEDVSSKAGPVEYFPGSHRLFDSEEKLERIKVPGEPLEAFFDRVRAEALAVAVPAEALLRKGDVLIWHHALPHSGKIAVDPTLTRHSMVFHMGAEGVNVRGDGLFERSPGMELPRYGKLRRHGRTVARVGLPALMI